MLTRLLLGLLGNAPLLIKELEEAITDLKTGHGGADKVATAVDNIGKIATTLGAALSDGAAKQEK